MSIFLPKNQVVSIVKDSIENRKILLVEYQHTSDDILVVHKIAPFDIGSTNPQTRERNANNLYAYSYTHLDRKTNCAAPRVCTFNINNFIRMTASDENFDETELTKLNLAATNYDYRNCRFALLPDRNWYK